MRKGVCLKNNLNSRYYVSSFISSISNDVMINNLINDLINRDGVTNFFWNENGLYYYLESDSEFLSIVVEGNNIYASNNFDGICQQISYERSLDGVRVIIDNKSKIEMHNNYLYRDVQFERIYDCNDKLIYEGKTVETNDRNNDPDENCCSVISKFFFDDEVIKVHSMSYAYKPLLNNTKYFIVKNDEQVLINKDDFDSFHCKKKVFGR